MTDTELEGIVKERIQREGPITFAQFMEMALYHVLGGYYTSACQHIGPRGDFYTSPLAHPAFGALIAIQLEQMWELMGASSRFFVVELGSGKGTLARDILDYSRHLGQAFHRALRYITVERDNEYRQEGWDTAASIRLPFRQLHGCVLSNELLDAMPVHRVVQQGDTLKEIYVGLKNGHLTDVVGELSTPRLRQRLENLGASLEDGQEAEVNLLLEDWVQDVAGSLERGYLITIDYGYPANELYSPARPRGTLMCHYRHTTNRKPFLRVGEQDITSHVDISSLTSIGEKHGLWLCGVVSQAQFLDNLNIRAFIGRFRTLDLPSGEYHANRMGMQNLIDPEGLGKFRVVIQRKGEVSDQLQGLSRERPGKRGPQAEKSNPPVPLLTDHHIDLLRGKYPHMAWSPPE